mmetsp:Transcript_112710/g.351421  ORF Transcript_112710/g.351421 Transcript_112710/m.351421 type:complete len:476 (+) Transcript_112710:89-1516(+)
MLAPAQSWAHELGAYEREKRHAVDDRTSAGPPARLPKGHVQKMDRFFDPLLQRFREPRVEESRRSQEGKHSLAHLNRAQDIHIMREQPFNIVTHESKLEALAPGKDPVLLGGNPGTYRRTGKAMKTGCTAEKDFHILSNLPCTEHHWAPPEERPPAKEVKLERRKLHAHLVKDFNIVTNRFTEHHEDKDRQIQHLSLLESTQKYMKQNRFNPVTQQFNDPRHEELVRTADNAREVEIVMRAEAKLPPSTKGRQSEHYGIISHEVHDEDAVKMWDALEEGRTDRYKNRYIFEHNVHAQEVKGSHVTNSRRLNRIAPERFEEPRRRGYDIIDNCGFGEGPREKPLHEAFTKVRATPWEKATEGGRAAVPPPRPHRPPSSSSSTPALQATLRLSAPSEAEERQHTGSGNAQQLRTPSARSATTASAAASAASGRSSLRKSELRPSPPGQTRPVLAPGPPPAPSIPGDAAGAVFSRPRS